MWNYLPIGDNNTYLTTASITFAEGLSTPSISSVSNTGSGIKVVWGTVSGATSYRLERQYSYYGWELVGTTTSTSYTDTDTLMGTQYTYRVIAYSPSLSWSNYSATKTLTRNPFTDVNTSASYFSSVAWAYNNGIVKGTSSTTFSPNADCTRGQFALMLYRLAGKPDVSGVNPFRDVKKSDSYYKAVIWAYNAGIIKGTSATTFNPNGSVTRGQIVLMLYRAAGKPTVTNTTNPFTDVKKSDSYYQAVLWALNTGITKGTSSTTFSPNDNCTRYQLVTFLYRFMN